MQTPSLLRQLADLLELPAAFKTQMEIVMSQLDDLNAALTLTQAAVTSLSGRVATAQAALNAHIADLTAQIAANAPVDLAASLATLQQIQASLAGIDPAAPVVSSTVPVETSSTVPVETSSTVA